MWGGERFLLLKHKTICSVLDDSYLQVGEWNKIKKQKDSFYVCVFEDQLFQQRCLRCIQKVLWVEQFVRTRDIRSQYVRDIFTLCP